MWIDQVGYGLYVRPWLRRRKSRVRLAIQVSLGNGLMIGLASALLGLLLARLDHPLTGMQWATLAASCVIGTALGELNPWAEPAVDTAIAGLGAYSIGVAGVLAERGQAVASLPHGVGAVLRLCYGVRQALLSGGTATRVAGRAGGRRSVADCLRETGCRCGGRHCRSGWGLPWQPLGHALGEGRHDAQVADREHVWHVRQAIARRGTSRLTDTNAHTSDLFDATLMYTCRFVPNVIATPECAVELEIMLTDPIVVDFTDDWQ